jgi:hypothetical protein
MPWADPEHRKKYHKQYNLKYKERAKELRAKQTPAQKKQHAEYMRNYVLQREYGIDAEEYERMWVAQLGLCAICGDAESKGRGRLHVDHCHKTNKVRKLLCVTCNMALGVYERNHEKFSKYIRDNQ